jgi:hypothetical protein
MTNGGSRTCGVAPVAQEAFMRTIPAGCHDDPSSTLFSDHDSGPDKNKREARTCSNGPD